MQSFRFTLQAVRTLRLRQEQAALAHYLRAVQTHERDRDELRRIQCELEAAWVRLRQGLPAGLSARQLSQLHAYSWTVEERRRAGEAAGQLSLQLMSQAAQSLRLARQQREVVDKYYDKQKRSHDRRLQLAEQKLMDDLAYQGPASAGLVDSGSATGWN